MRKTSLLALPLLLAVAPPGCTSSKSAPAADAGAPPNFSAVPTTRSVTLQNLQGKVDVVRDQYGTPHIYATSPTDALRVEGYQVARDRTAQLELIRRTAEGKTAEIFGDTAPSLIDSDISMRMLGLTRVSQQMYDALDPSSEMKAWLDAYADGISQFNANVQSGKELLPPSMIALPTSAFVPWTGVDVLAVGRLQSWNLSYDSPYDIDNTSFVQASQATFNAAATDPLLAKRAGLLVDVVRFAPLDPTTVLSGYPNATTTMVAPKVKRTTAGAHVDPGVLSGASAWLAATQRVHGMFARADFGSNDWIVGPSMTTTGHAMLANDPHLALSGPATFWPVHVNVTSSTPTENLDFAGMGFPGLPGVILGFNDDVAWGATDAFFDVSDAYSETLTPDGGSVMFNGQAVALQTVHEEILVANSPPVEYDVLIVPQHGPIVPTIVNHAVVAPDPTKGAISVKWTGFVPTQDLNTVVGYLNAKTVTDAMKAAESFAVGAENWVYADVKGNIAYSAHAMMPTRAKGAFTWSPSTFTGTLPCFVLPGDGSAEWTGTLADEFLPQAVNPSAGFLVTANNTQYGTTLDDDPSNDTLPNGQPFYWQAFYENGLRAGRITKDITTAGKKLSLVDMATIQADTKSNLAATLVPSIAASIGKAQAEAQTPGTHPDLTAIVADPRFAAANVGSIAQLLTSWGTEAEFDTRAGVSLDNGSNLADPVETSASEATLIFNAWLVNMEHLVFGDEITKMAAPDVPYRIDLRGTLTYLMGVADPTKLATYDAATGDSALYDDLTTTPVETRDERTIHALLDAIDLIKGNLGSDQTQWRWGKMHTLTFASLVSLWGTLSIPPNNDPVFPHGFPRHGEAWTVDVADYGDWLTPASSGFSFAYTNGPNQRLVIDMDPVNGPTAYNALPGGAVWDNKSKHFRDEAELWRRNENHPVWIAPSGFLSGVDEHVVYAP
jgi:penicillin amidase